MSVYLPPPSLNSSHSSLMGCSTGSNFFSYKIASSLLQLEPFFHGDFRLGGEGCCGQLSGGDVISKNPEPSCCAACATYIYPTPPPVLPSSSIRSLFPPPFTLPTAKPNPRLAHPHPSDHHFFSIFPLLHRRRSQIINYSYKQRAHEWSLGNGRCSTTHDSNTSQSTASLRLELVSTIIPATSNDNEPIETWV
jgi:hypothetical protein